MNTFIHVEVWKFLVAAVLYVCSGGLANTRYWLVGLALVVAATILVVGTFL